MEIGDDRYRLATIGQEEVFHFYMHVFPRYREDGFGLKRGKKNFIKMPQTELDKVSDEIKNFL